MIEFLTNVGNFCHNAIPYVVGAFGLLIAVNGALSAFAFDIKGSQTGSQFWFPIGFALTRLGEMATGLVMIYFGFLYGGF